MPDLIQQVKSISVARDKSTNAILQEIIKSGISLTEKLNNERKTLSTRQQSSLQNFGAPSLGPTQWELRPLPGVAYQACVGHGGHMR